ncbi:MAG TPA: DUF1501 domain-containing protein [Pirellulales bacterium]|jgi:hypothetical protein|nr:DUF1501 domain-containing protein [Pirellulales bacterium]
MFNPTTMLSKCPGTLDRREFVRSGLVGLSSLGLADLFALESQAAAAGGSHSSNKALLVLWLWGGPSHMETFDLKPLAPAEYRGEFRPIATSVPGIEISEHLPLLAARADKFSLLRSCHHDSPGHVNSTHTMLTGYPGELAEAPPFRPKYPDVWAVTNQVLGERAPGMPPHVVLPTMRYQGSAYLGQHLEPLVVAGDPNEPSFTMPNLTAGPAERPRIQTRLSLLKEFDRLRHDIDQAGHFESLDRFQQKAAALLTSDRVARAFDINQEETATRDRYGRNVVGQRCLLARRLIEAGARIVSVDFATVPGQKAFSWDDHASVWNIFEEMRRRLPVLDQVVAALIDDLHDRGLSDEVLLVVMGEMSHTPRLSNFNGQPGREHWGNTMSLLLSGGGLRMGQVVGATNRKGDEIIERPITPGDVLATWYRALGVPLDLQFTDLAGRPTPILLEGSPIKELC